LDDKGVGKSEPQRELAGKTRVIDETTLKGVMRVKAVTAMQAIECLDRGKHIFQKG